MTDDERALGYLDDLDEPWRAGDTEARALRAYALEEHDTLVLQGQNHPCDSCQAYMIQKSQLTGAEIEYHYTDYTGVTRVFSGRAGMFVYP